MSSSWERYDYGLRITDKGYDAIRATIPKRDWRGLCRPELRLVKTTAEPTDGGAP